MADDLAIQAQVQPQVKRKDNTLPYTLGGAVIGGAAGAAFPMIKTKYSSWEDVVKESEDTFNKQIDKGGDNKTYWETAKEQAQKINEAEKNYDAEVEKIKNENKTTKVTVTDLPDSEKALKDELTNAQKAYDNELKNLVDSEKSKLASSGKATTTATIKPAAEMSVPTRFKDFTEFEKAYKPLQQAYETAISSSHSTADYVAAQTKYNSMESTITDLYNNAQKKAEKFKNPARAFEQKKNGGMFTSILKPFGISDTSIYNDILTEVENKIYPTPSGLTQEQIRGLGEFKNETDPANIGKIKKALTKTEELHIIKDKSGKLIGYVKVPKGTYDQALDIIQKEAKEQQKKIAEELLGNARERFNLRAQISDFDKNFKVSDELMKKAGVTSPIGLDTAANYEADMKVIEKVKGLDRSRLLSPELSIVDKYTTTGSPRDAYNMVEARKTIAKKYEAGKKVITDKLDNILTQDSRLAELKQEMQNVENKDKGVRKATGNLRKKFPEFFTTTSNPALSDTEIASKAEEAAKKAIEGKKVATDLKTVQNKVAEKIKELGLEGKELSKDELDKIVTEKLGTKTEYTEKVRKTAQEAIEKNLEKYTKGSRGWTALAGAAVLALAGLGIAAATKKDA